MNDRSKIPPTHRPRIGLVLGGGGARGWAHIGVLRALERIGFEPDVVCGTSIGGLVGGVWLAGSLDALEGWAVKLNRRRIVRAFDFRIGSGGLMGGRTLMREMERHVGDVTIEALPRPFGCVATDLVTGHEVWLRRGGLIEALRATISLPGLFTPVPWHGRWLVDGAIVNPVPVTLARSLGAQLVVAVDLHMDYIGKARIAGETFPRAMGFDLEEELEGGKGFLSGLVGAIFRREPHAPSMFGVMVGAYNIIQDRLTRSRLAGDPPDVTIEPRLAHIGFLEFDCAKEAIAEGEAAVDRAMPQIEEAMAIVAGYGEGEDDEA